MKTNFTAVVFCCLFPLLTLANEAGNRLRYLNEPANPYYVSHTTARLTTPQWIGEEGVEAAIVLAVDDMGDVTRYEAFLRPILERLKQIDGRAPLSIMTKYVDPQLPQLQNWLKEGVSIETHTYDHPCPCLQGGKLSDAKKTFDRSVDELWQIPGNRPVAFRMPCCDSMNSVSPRFFAQIFTRTTPAGRYLNLDSSVMLLFTPKDTSLPQNLTRDEEQRERFRKYIPTDRLMVNYVEDYPYPWVIAGLCWEIPPVMPSDWDAQNLNGKCSPASLQDWKAAIDAVVLKQGVFSICFHPHGWTDAQQINALIEYAHLQHGKKIKFLNFREVQARLDTHLLAGQPLRNARGEDNGVRVCDVNHDGYMDVTIGNRTMRKTRLWLPQSKRWEAVDFPVQLTTTREDGTTCDAGVRWGVLEKDGNASIVVRNGADEGLWHLREGRWVRDPQGLRGLERQGEIQTVRDGRDCGVRMCDVNADGICELIVGNSEQNGSFVWTDAGWRFSCGLPDGVTIIDKDGRDAGLRFVDFTRRGTLDLVFSNAEHCGLFAFTSLSDGWTRKFTATRGDGPNDLPMIVRADGSNNGVWFSYGYMWVQNEDTGKKEPEHLVGRSFAKGLLENDTPIFAKR